MPNSMNAQDVKVYLHQMFVIKFICAVEELTTSNMGMYLRVFYGWKSKLQRDHKQKGIVIWTTN